MPHLNPLGDSVLNAMRSAIGPGPHGLHEPTFAGDESANLQECIDSTFVSSVGPFVDRFERAIGEYTGAKFVVATMNGTAALHVALLLAGVERDDEVLVPSLSFVATAAAVRYCGAIPHFVDSSEGNLGMDPTALRDWLRSTTEMHSGFARNRLTGRRIRALVPMHTFGHPCDLDSLLAVGREFNLALVEDAAESLGSWYQGQHTGTFGLLGILSFNGNKTITTGGGGAILTDSREMGLKAKHLTTTAKVPHQWGFVHDQVGFNYRMPNINAALGCAQLAQLTEFLASKRRLFERYHAAFGSLSGASILAEPSGCVSNYWLQTLLLDKNVEEQRDSILAATNDAGFMTRPAWELLHRLSPYTTCPRAPLPIAESLERRIVNLPSSAGLA
jgi:perosamine synthetase